MILLKRSTSEDVDFIKLIKELDQDLAHKNGDNNEFFVQFNKIDLIRNVVIIYENDIAVGCGAFKKYCDESIEIKRMFVDPSARNKGFATAILRELTNWAKELNYSTAILETGDKMTEAIHLYQKEGFTLTPNYPPYDNEPTSKCFKKNLLN